MKYLFPGRARCSSVRVCGGSARVVFLVIAVLNMVSCGRKTPPAAALPPKPVETAKAILRDVPLYLDEIGNCTAFETVTIQPQVSGPITEIHFTDGQEVKKGDMLFTIDPRPYQAALDKAIATLDQDRAKDFYNQAQLKRNEELSKTKVVAPQDLDSARSNALASASTLKADEAAIEQARINFDYCSIRSPIDGRASKRMVDVGNVVAANATQLLLIQRQDPIYVDFTIPESALPKVRSYLASGGGSLKIQASFADDPAKNRTGEFNFLDSGVQQNSGTVRMRALLENKDRLFWPGQFVNVRILLDSLKDAVLVPNDALQIGANGPSIFIVKPDNTVELRLVKPGQRQGADLVISEGLKADETVVTTGQLGLAPGTKVAVVTGK